MKKALLVSLGILTTCIAGQFPPAFAGASHAQLELLAENDAVVPGTDFRVAVRFRIEPEWHLYWKNPGDSGLAPKIEWTLPEGVIFLGLKWPFPERIDDASGTTYGYREEAVLIAEFRTTERFAAAEATIGVQGRWVACSSICVSESGETRIVLPVRESSSPTKEELFSKADLRIPYGNPHWTFGARTEGNKLYLGILPPPGRLVPEHVLFFPEDPELFLHEAAQEFASSDAGAELILLLSGIVKEPKRVKGILVSDAAWEEWDPRPALEVDTVVQP